MVIVSQTNIGTASVKGSNWRNFCETVRAHVGFSERVDTVLN